MSRIKDRSYLYPRLCFIMLMLSVFFWYTSWPTWLPRGILGDYPNCLDLKADFGDITFGFLSHHRHSGLFFSINLEILYKFHWEECSDGHYCGPLYWQYLNGISQSNLYLRANNGTFVWYCPYRFFIAFWGIAFYRANNNYRIRFSDFFVMSFIL